MTAGGGLLSSRPVPDRPAAREIQRKRILDGVVAVVAERGVAGASVEPVLARAGVSRRAFYECYRGLDECLVAVMDRTLEQVSVLAWRAFEQEGDWLDGMRGALAAVLEFFDAEPALARVCLVETLGGGPVVVAQRERVVAAFRALVVARIEGDVAPVAPLAAEGVLASVMGLARARLIAPEPQPLIELLGPLMGMAGAPYLDASAVEDQVRRGDELARKLLARREPRATRRDDAGADVPAMLLSARAHRARLCLLYVTEQGRRGFSPSNREVAEGIGVPHRGQVAKLLDRLAALGLLTKRRGRPGHPNAWAATDTGEKIASLLADDDGH